MNPLPEVLSGPAGLTVAGASSELLTELLDEYDAHLKELAPNSWTTMLPGLSHGEIVDRLAAIGLTPPEEMLIWWQWHNGCRPGVPNGLRLDQLRLEDAIKIYAENPKGLHETLWNPYWIGLAGGGVRPLAMSCETTDGASPLVRAIEPQLGSSTQEGSVEFQVASLCTPLTWLLTGFRDGLIVPDMTTGWLKYDFSRFPEVWHVQMFI